MTWLSVVFFSLQNFELETDNGLKGQEKDSSVLDSGLHSPRNDDDKDSNRPASWKLLSKLRCSY
jgi:hypothetical protein